MNLKAKINEKLSKILFLEIKKGSTIHEYKSEENVFFPVKSESLIEQVKDGENFENISIKYFIEGTFFVLGADENFKYKQEYIKFLKSIDLSLGLIKNKIYEEIKIGNYEDAYILLKGLLCLEENIENYENSFSIVDKLRNMEKEYEQEELQLIEKAKGIQKFPSPYLYETLISRDNKDFSNALYCLNTYIEMGGKETNEISELKENLLNINNYDKGRELVNEEPTEALKYLLPLIQYFGDIAELFYYIAVAYRNLENYEKAIYYLNEASSIDDSLIEVLNEYGINYAKFGDFDRAVKYFRKAFEATKSVDVCTNIIMCYLNMNMMKEAKEHMDIAIKINSEDEVVKELEKYFK